MNLIGKQIEHTVFGSGTVSELAAQTVTIRFTDDERKFIYPDAFKKHLEARDREIQRYIEKQICDRDAEYEQARQAEQRRQERARKASHFKVVANSHPVFHIPADQIDRVTMTCKVSTGEYLSGSAAGSPRKADRVKPNSVCLLTTRGAGDNENERRILGAFMVREDFFGEDCQDGIIEGHLKHRMILPKDCRLLLWKCLGQDAPRHWGTVAFKYCSGDMVNRILADMIELSDTSGGRDTAAEFYRYFCRMNSLPPLKEL